MWLCVTLVLCFSLDLAVQAEAAAHPPRNESPSVLKHPNLRNGNSKDDISSTTQETKLRAPTNATAVTLHHTADEGSSAMVEGLAISKPCVVNFGEHLLYPQYYKQGTYGKILDAFYRKGGFRPLELFETILENANDKGEWSLLEKPMKIAHNCCEQGYATFVVAKMYDHSTYIPQHRSMGTQFFSIRSDLLRCGLARYTDNTTMNLGIPRHPQFGHYTAPLLNYDINLLGGFVKSCVETWNKHMESLKFLHNNWKLPCSHTKILLYEDFNGNSSKFMDNWYASVTRDIAAALPDPNNVSLYTILRKQKLTKVHSDDIKLFVNNSDEVLKWFSKTAHPRFGKVLSEAAKDLACDVKQLMITSAR